MNVVVLFEDAPNAIGFVDKARNFSEPYGDDLARWRQDCPSGSWLLWAAGLCGVARTELISAACLCAREAFVYLPSDEKRPEQVIELVERWTRQEATVEECSELGDEIETVQQEIGDRCGTGNDFNVAGAMLAAGCAAMPTYAVKYSNDQRWCAHFSAQTVQMASGGAKHTKGAAAMWDMHKLCADIVRNCLPEFHLPEELPAKD